MMTYLEWLAASGSKDTPFNYEAYQMIWKSAEKFVREECAKEAEAFSHENDMGLARVIADAIRSGGC